MNKKKKYLAPDMEVLHIKEGEVLMSSHGFSCIGEIESCDELCHDCDWYEESDT